MKIKKVELSRRQQVELEYATYFDSKPFMQTRCKIILMKAEGQASQNIADQLGISVPMVNPGCIDIFPKVLRACAINQYKAPNQ